MAAKVEKYRNGYMADVPCKKMPWLFWDKYDDALALAVFCDAMPDCFFPPDEIPGMFSSAQWIAKKYARTNKKKASQGELF